MKELYILTRIYYLLIEEAVVALESIDIWSVVVVVEVFHEVNILFSALFQSEMSDHETDYEESQQHGRHGRWTAEEHRLFVEAITQFGREWDKVQTVVKTRSLAQIRSHAQKYFLKLSRTEELERIYVESLWSLSADGVYSQSVVDALSVLDLMSNVLQSMKAKRQRLLTEQESTKEDAGEVAEHSEPGSTTSFTSSERENPL